MFRFRLTTLLLITVLIGLAVLAWTGHSILIGEGKITVLRVYYHGRDYFQHAAVFALPLTVVGSIVCVSFLSGYGFAKVMQARNLTDRTGR